MDKETKSSQDTFTEQTIFDSLLTVYIFSKQLHKICCAVKYLMFP